MTIVFALSGISGAALPQREEATARVTSQNIAGPGAVKSGTTHFYPTLYPTGNLPSGHAPTPVVAQVCPQTSLPEPVVPGRP